MVSEPSALGVTASVVLPMVNLSISLGMKNIASSYLARFHIPATGGIWPGSKCST